MDLPPPPPTPAVPPPPVNPTQTNRERVEAMTAAATPCTACHRIIDPPGFVLEAYDAIGAWQTVEKDSGLPIDTVANVRMSDSETVTIHDPAELMQRIASARSAQLTYAKRWIAYAYQRQENPSDACTADQLAVRIGRTGYSVLDLLVDITSTDSFRLRAREVP